MLGSPSFSNVVDQLHSTSRLRGGSLTRANKVSCVVCERVGVFYPMAERGWYSSLRKEENP